MVGQQPPSGGFDPEATELIGRPGWAGSGADEAGAEEATVVVTRPAAEAEEATVVVTRPGSWDQPQAAGPPAAPLPPPAARPAPAVPVTAAPPPVVPVPPQVSPPVHSRVAPPHPAANRQPPVVPFPPPPAPPAPASAGWPAPVSVPAPPVPPPAPPVRRSLVSWPVGTAVLAAAVAAVLGLVWPGWLVGKRLDLGHAEAAITALLADPANSFGASVSDVRCNDGQAPKVRRGSSFTCRVVIDGQARQVTATFTDDRGDYVVSAPQ